LLDLEATSQLDTTSVDALELIRTRLEQQGVALYLVRVFYSARQVLKRSGFLDRLGEGRMWHSISAGARAARREFGIEGKSHPQEIDDETVEDDRIAADDDQTAGYVDPADERKWWQH
jgi:sulfate permease, SulP family